MSPSRRVQSPLTDTGGSGGGHGGEGGDEGAGADDVGFRGGGGEPVGGEGGGGEGATTRMTSPHSLAAISSPSSDDSCAASIACNSGSTAPHAGSSSQKLTETAYGKPAIGVGDHDAALLGPAHTSAGARPGHCARMTS